MSSAAETFQVTLDPEQITDLQSRIRNTRWPEDATCDGWDQGVPLAYAKDLADYWANHYDWNRIGQILNRWPQQRVRLNVEGDDYTIHCIHHRSPHPGARPLLLTHGWPGSVLEFHKVIDALVDPESHGGNASDAFHIVAPSLPGYGFSDKPSTSGTSVERIADVWNALMGKLGYDHYFAQGGDWGSIVTCALGLRHGANCAGININMIVAPPDPDAMENLSDLEQAALAAMERYAKVDSGYSKIQSTRPQTLGYALSDSPVGQMAWIVEKFWSWTDCEKDGTKHPENALSRDEMLDTVTLYWLTGTAASSARLYWESFSSTNLEPVPAPMGGSLFPRDIFMSSERWARKRFPNLRYWNELDRGGHFAALEQPQLFVDEMRACFRVLEQG